MMYKLSSGAVVNTDEIFRAYIAHAPDGKKHQFNYYSKRGEEFAYSGTDLPAMETDLENIMALVNDKTTTNIIPKGGKPVIQQIKSYFQKNQDVIISLAIIILIDQFLFDGQFREKIKSMMESWITKTEKKLGHDPEVGSGE